ncbi:phage major capsid protein [Bacillus sp. ISL-75]|uniref:phage major capsid family protein n=1 Tax=Bacillus sp. ISL-75 TaxID=2819137 RepID=UPI001BE7B988|nr:phage major capsid protein [Bacillus sp. ISL-75]MBT2727845.1 phage major capsid protein [Bacillus sp. ISL-75]
MATNQTIIEKAAMKLSDLAAGGQMSPEQFNAFYRKIIDQPTILRDARNVPMKSDSMKVEKIGFGSRILRKGTEGTALADVDRAVPTTSTVQLNAKEVIAEVNITYDTLENNIEGEGLKNTLMDMIAARAALDIEELLINGDTTSSDTFLAVLNGLRKKATSHVIDGTNSGVAFSKSVFLKAMNAVPAKYRRNPSEWRFYSSFANELAWKDTIASRQTNLGDTAIQGALASAYGVPVQGIAMLQDYDFDGGGAGTATGSDLLFTHPKNIIAGFSRNVRVEVDKDIRERKFIIVLTAKLDAQFEEEDAVAKYQKILTPTF